MRGDEWEFWVTPVPLELCQATSGADMELGLELGWVWAGFRAPNKRMEHFFPSELPVSWFSLLLQGDSTLENPRIAEVGKNLWDHRVQAVTQHQSSALVAKTKPSPVVVRKRMAQGENSVSKDTSSVHKACENKSQAGEKHTVHSKLLLLFTFPLEMLRVKQNSSPAGVC